MARILIVDDDPDLVQIITILLSSWGYEVASAGDPAGGQEVCRSFKPDLILLDYNMPGATGAHLYETFRRNQATARTPVIFMSAMASPEVVLGEITEAALTRFLPKPVDKGELRRNIVELLEAVKSG